MLHYNTNLFHKLVKNLSIINGHLFSLKKKQKQTKNPTTNIEKPMMDDCEEMVKKWFYAICYSDLQIYDTQN